MGMLFHPTTTILIAIISMLIFFKKERVFQSIAILFPLFSAYIFFMHQESGHIYIYNLRLAFEFSAETRLLASAFFCVLFIANIYSYSQGKKLEIIFGSAYGAFSFLCLFAHDFFSLFIGLEMMMVFSSIIIFIGGAHASLRYARRYFFTHLLSSNMIIIGIAHFIIMNDSALITPAGELLYNTPYSQPIILIMLTGMLINIAIFPFSGWMVRYYPKASPSGFLYLISFTTKVSIVLMAKLFAGVEFLRYVAIVMIIYSAIKAVNEKNLFSIACFLSIIAMGFMLIGISIGTPEAISAVISYLFLHVIYKLLLSLALAILADKKKITLYNDLHKINSKLFVCAVIASILVMINFPLSSTFFIKSTISHGIDDPITYYILLFLAFMTMFLVPCRGYIRTKKIDNIELDLPLKFCLSFMTIVTIATGFFGGYIPILKDLNSFTFTNIAHFDLIKQSLIILIAFFMSYHLLLSKTDTRPINLNETIADIAFSIYKRFIGHSKNAREREPWEFKKLEKQIIENLRIFHNQKTAIFIVFSFFILMLVELLFAI